MSGNFEGIKKQKFGVEIECTGLTRAAAAKAAQKVLGGRLDHFGGFYDSYHVWDSKNRKWQFMSDASIRCTKKDGTPASKLHSVEVVTPVLEYEDIPLLQEVVRAVRKKGGVCNESTGIHIHIDGAPYDAKKIRNLVNIFASKEDMLYKALMVNSRRETYCEKSEKRFVEQMNKVRPKDMETVKRLWYGDSRDHNGHYDPSRYRCLNLHSLFQHNNFEVRAFNSSLNAGVLRAYLSLVLAVSNQALTQKSASPRVTQSENPKYTFRCWLIRIGLNGEEFKNCRKHLLSHLEGNCAWLHPEDAIKQRERLKAEREAARAEPCAAVSAVEPTGDTVTEEQTQTAENELVNVFANEEYEEDSNSTYNCQETKQKMTDKLSEKLTGLLNKIDCDETCKKTIECLDELIDLEQNYTNKLIEIISKFGKCILSNHASDKIINTEFFKDDFFDKNSFIAFINNICKNDNLKHMHKRLWVLPKPQILSTLLKQLRLFLSSSF